MLRQDPHLTWKSGSGNQTSLYARILILLCPIYNFGGKKTFWGGWWDASVLVEVCQARWPALLLTQAGCSNCKWDNYGRRPQTKSGMGPLRPSRNFPQQKSEVGGVGPVLLTDHPHFRILKTIATLSWPFLSALRVITISLNCPLFSWLFQIRASLEKSSLLQTFVFSHFLRSGVSYRATLGWINTALMKSKYFVKGEKPKIAVCLLQIPRESKAFSDVTTDGLLKYCQGWSRFGTDLLLVVTLVRPSIS